MNMKSVFSDKSRRFSFARKWSLPVVKAPTQPFHPDTVAGSSTRRPRSRNLLQNTQQRVKAQHRVRFFAQTPTE